jgi:simple sugar transport system substrate-binding protein
MDMRDPDEIEEYQDPDTEKGISRRQLLRRAALGTTALTIPSILGALGSRLSPAEAATLKSAAAARFPAHKTFRFTFVNHVTTNPFFVPTRYGAEDACTAFGCTYQWTGSVNSLVSEMVNAMNAAIAARVDGIAVAIIDPHAFAAPINRALAAGIPVLAYNADAPASVHNPRMSYIGQDLYLSGQKMGQRVVNLVGHGDVALFIATPGSLNIQPRIDGAVYSIKHSGKPITPHEVATGALVTDELARIEAYYLGHKSFRGFFAVDGGSTQSVGQIAAKYGLQAKGIRTGGYDLTPITLQGIQSGHLNFTIDQQPYLQGFIPVLQLFLYKISGGLLAPSDTNTGLKFVTRQNAGKYLSTTSRYEGNSATPKWIH